MPLQQNNFIKYATHKLPSLSYSYDSLSPYMSLETLSFHHQINHEAYVSNINHLIKWSDMKNIPRDSSLEDIITQSYVEINMEPLFNNASQHWNHILFWQCMKPNGGGAIPSELEKKLNEDFGSVNKFKRQFIKLGTKQIGSGWVWLVINHDGKLIVVSTPNSHSPLLKGMHPILCCDLWEHSYFIDYKNKRYDYLVAFLEYLVNWEFVASQIN